MALVPRQGVSVGTSSPTRLDADPTDSAAGDRILIVAQGSGTLVLGPSSVTAGNGCRIPVVAGTTVAIDLDQGEQVWGIVASGSVIVDVLMSGA